MGIVVSNRNNIFFDHIYFFSCHSEALYQRKEKRKGNWTQCGGVFVSLSDSLLKLQYFSGMNIVGKFQTNHWALLLLVNISGSQQNLMRLDQHQSCYRTQTSNGRKYVFIKTSLGRFWTVQHSTQYLHFNICQFTLRSVAERRSFIWTRVCVTWLPKVSVSSVFGLHNLHCVHQLFLWSSLLLTCRSSD